MPISRENNLIFVHIPKNAGESIEKSLGMYRGDPNQTFWGIIGGRLVLQHMSALQIRQRLRDEMFWENATKFAVVRNPWSKAVSEYNWYLRYGARCDFKTWARSLPYRLFINNVITILEIGHNLPQHEFIYDEGQLLVDEVLRFENIQEDFDALMQKIGMEAELQHAQSTASKGPKRDFRSYYDEETVRIIEDIYQEDLEIFGYTREETFGG